MKNNTFKNFFQKATKFPPYKYQEDMASLSPLPTILNISTGCGKTEAAILPWLWRRSNMEQNTPRRLIYCMPIRSLVDQTVIRINKWLKQLKMKNKINLVVLMGGNIKKDFVNHPEKDTIIIGTQDMLLSRALNRGYGISPFRWPVEFGLMNNDCMWVIDELQLMENGLATSLQLEAFRKNIGTYGPSSHTMWMSATVNKESMKTVDFKKHVEFKIGDKDTELAKIIEAKKQLKNIDITPKNNSYEKEDVDKIIKLHRKKPTIIIINKVKRAQNLFKQIKEKNQNAILIHSRFRPHERVNINKQLLEIQKDEDIIIVSTQAIEAGMDISSHTMITELAPVSSMIQRFGRCNRKGEYDDAIIYWIDLDLKKDLVVPYVENDLKNSRKWLISCKSAASKDLSEDAGTSSIYDTVLRKSDLFGLFDTLPDISGSYLDVSRFVRKLEKQADVKVYWRTLNDSIPKKDMNKCHHEEICNVSISSFKEFLKTTKNRAWYYDYRNENYEDNPWQEIESNEIRSGQIFLLDTKQGGYSKELGWEDASKELVDMVFEERESTNDPKKDQLSNNWISLDKHSMHTCSIITSMINELNSIDEKMKEILQRAALYHDLGKSHDVFQNTLKNGKHVTKKNDIWAKSPNGGKHARQNFRHEVASALVYLKHNPTCKESDLVAFLIASHHGKVRLALRSINKNDPLDKYLLGFDIGGNDILPAINLGDNKIPETKIDMSLSEIGMTEDGRHSWISRTLNLLKEYGPFKLGYLESILRAADVTASKMEAQT